MAHLIIGAVALAIMLGAHFFYKGAGEDEIEQVMEEVIQEETGMTINLNDGSKVVVPKPVIVPAPAAS